MSLEPEHVEYGLQLALTVLTMSLVLMVDFSNVGSYVYLLGLPFLFGYTAATSEYDFKKSSLGSAISLVFIPIGGFVAPLAVFVFSCNVMVSFFASGSSFKDHYSSTAIPLILMGVIIGGGLAGYASYDSDFEESLQNRTIETATERTIEMVEVAGIDRNRTQENVKRVSESSITLTEARVVQEYSKNNEEADLEALRSSFDSAKEEVPDTVLEQSSGADIEESTRNMLDNTLSGRISAAVLLLSITVFYGMQPVLRFLTAFSAQLFVFVRDAL